MIRPKRTFLAISAVAALIVGFGVVTPFGADAAQKPAAPAAPAATAPAAPAAVEQVRFSLVPTNSVMAKCMPKMKLDVTVKLTEELIGKDIFKVRASGLAPNTPFTIFLTEQPDDPFGAVEYFGDLETDARGNAHNSFTLIVDEAFASTLVDGVRTRVDLDHVGMWFADPAGDDFCLGAGKGKTTPFDGDAEAGEQVMNSANALPGTPLPQEDD